MNRAIRVKFQKADEDGASSDSSFTKNFKKKERNRIDDEKRGQKLRDRLRRKDLGKPVKRRERSKLDARAHAE